MDFNTVKNWVSQKYPQHDNSKVTMISGAIMAYLNAHQLKGDAPKEQTKHDANNLPTKVESFEQKTGIPYKDALKKVSNFNPNHTQMKPQKKVFISDMEKAFYLMIGSLVALGILTKIFGFFV